MKKQKGSILIFLLWVIAFLSFIVMEFGREVHLKAKTASCILEAKKDYFTAYSLIQEAIVRLSLPEDDERRILPNGQEIELSFDNQKAKIRVEDEEEKININLVDAETLFSFLTEKIGFPSEKAEELVDCILDYRDADNVPRPYGAEEDYYLSLSPPYKPANSAFKTLEELLFVKGITPEIFWSLYNFLTVYGKNVKYPKKEEKEPIMVKGHYYRFVCEIKNHFFVIITYYLGHGRHRIVYRNEYYKS